MAIFFGMFELNKKYPNITIEEMIEKEMSDYGLKYKFSVEENNVKVDFITEEDEVETRCKEELRNRLMQDLKDNDEIVRLYNGPKSEFIDNVIKNIEKMNFTYNEYIENYNQILSELYYINNLIKNTPKNNFEQLQKTFKEYLEKR